MTDADPQDGLSIFTPVPDGPDHISRLRAALALAESLRWPSTNVRVHDLGKVLDELAGAASPAAGDAVDDEEREPSADRRELWHLESFLAVSGTTDTHRARGRQLRRYLDQTCEHYWRDVSGFAGAPKGTRQCSWCSTVRTPEETT
ncbi:hypothetical protein [Thalassiella azotivora]